MGITEELELPVIKPCPFCGGPAELNLGGWGERYVTCADDNCGGRLGAGIWFATDIDAVRVWNCRDINGSQI